MLNLNAKWICCRGDAVLWFYFKNGLFTPYSSYIGLRVECCSREGPLWVIFILTFIFITNKFLLLHYNDRIVVFIYLLDTRLSTAFAFPAAFFCTFAVVEINAPLYFGPHPFLVLLFLALPSNACGRAFVIRENGYLLLHVSLSLVYVGTYGIIGWFTAAVKYGLKQHYVVLLLLLLILLKLCIIIIGAANLFNEVLQCCPGNRPTKERNNCEQHQHKVKGWWSAIITTQLLWATYVPHWLRVVLVLVSESIHEDPNVHIYPNSYRTANYLNSVLKLKLLNFYSRHMFSLFNSSLWS